MYEAATVARQAARLIAARTAHDMIVMGCDPETRMASYKFIFDNDCQKAAEFFPKHRIVNLKQAGLGSKASDREIVKVASEREWIIITANGDHFISEINRYLRQTTRAVCHDLSGLVILPNQYQVQRQALRRIEERLVLEGRKISWKDVWKLDCCVRITKNGAAHITRFPRCFYCKKMGAA